MTKPFQMKADYSNYHDGINAYDAPDERGRGAKKEQFHTDAKAMLRAVIKIMSEEGWGGKVISNRGGIAVSGEVSALLTNKKFQRGIYVQYSSIVSVGRESDGLAILVQLRDENRRIVGANIWINADVSSYQLAERLMIIAETRCK